MMVKYSIAVCNKNMADTLERSLKSILNQIDDRFEMIVIDDGSVDNSVNILKNLSKEYKNLRYLHIEPDKNRNLGETRNISFENSRGKYILESLDTDDIYEKGIKDFVEIFHQIEKNVVFDFYLKGDSINMAKKSFLIDIPYRSLGRAQDKDLWRRLFASNSIIWLEHKRFWRQLGYKKNLAQKMKNEFKSQITTFQVGIKYWSVIFFYLKYKKLKKFFWNLITNPFSYIYSLTKKRYSTPEQFRDYGQLERTINKKKATIKDIEKKFNFKFDKNKLSKSGIDIFYFDSRD